VFDAEMVGETLMDITPRLPATDNFQHWPPWRPLVVETARRVLDFTGGTLVIPWRSWASRTGERSARVSPNIPFQLGAATPTAPRVHNQGMAISSRTVQFDDMILTELETRIRDVRLPPTAPREAPELSALPVQNPGPA
jgi:hypothetical protein